MYENCRMKNRTSLFNLKQRMRENVWSIDKYDLPMVAKWLVEIEERLETKENKKK